MKASLTVAEFSAVFAAGQALFSFPIKLIAAEQPLSAVGSSVIKTGFSVPKRMVKLAVQRNRLKRQMRAAFQRHEIVLRETFLARQTSCCLIFIYSDRQTNVPFSLIEDAIGSNVKALVDSGR